MKTLNVRVYGEEDRHLRGMIEIESSEFLFVDIGRYGGLQSHFDGDHPNHKAMESKLFQIAELIQDVVDLSK